MTGKFYMKNITLEEFLAQQMVSRVKTRFREKGPLRRYVLKLVTGKFVREGKSKFFLISFSAENLLFVSDSSEKASMEKEIFKNIFEETSDVIYGYKFKDFDLSEIVEKNSGERLLVPKEDIYLFKKSKLGINAILGGIN